MSEKVQSFTQDLFGLVKKHFSKEPVKEQKFSEVTLQDGTVIYYDGEAPVVGTAVFVVDPNGQQLPAPDGIHVLADGSQIEVSGGMITAVKPSENPVPSPEAQAPAPGMMSDNVPSSPEAQAKRIIESIVKEQVFAKVEDVNAASQAIEVLTSKVAEYITKLDEINSKFAKYEAFMSELTEKVADIEKQPVAQVEPEKKEFKSEISTRKSWINSDPKEINKSIFK